MRVVLALLLCWSVNAQAEVSAEVRKNVLEAQARCENFVQFDADNLYLGFGPYLQLEQVWPRPQKPGSVRIVPLDGSDAFDLKTRDGAISIARQGDELIVLTHSEIEIWNLPKRTRVGYYPTYYLGRSLQYKEHATGMALYDGKLYISHGRLGLSVFDIKGRHLSAQMRLLPNQTTMESMATAITIDGATAYVVMDNFSLPTEGKVPFRGIISVDLARTRVLREMPGLDPGASAVVNDGKDMIVSYMGLPLWVYNLAALTERTVATPSRRVSKLPEPGLAYGRAALDSSYYYTCYVLHLKGERPRWVPRALGRELFSYGQR